MSYLDLLKDSAENKGNILCFGIDPAIEKIPIEGNNEEKITRFFLDILDAMESENIDIPTVKPNIAFFEKYGFEGLKALKKIIEEYKKKNINVILDAKRGDIGNTASAYAKAVFDFWKADAVTLHPYLGFDSIKPFLDYKAKGSYVLVRTSNKSAVEVQDLVIDEEPLYKKVAELVIKWHRPGLGAVVGATYPKELKELSNLFVASNKNIPMLIPGVGSQGASAGEVMDILKRTETPLWLHRVNSSSGISYAYEKDKSDDYSGSAVKEMKRLIKELRI
jgi:orotidine-5'-phosphate decarboxylase